MLRHRGTEATKEERVKHSAHQEQQAIDQKTTMSDRLGRRIEYLRVSVTDRCDLRCAYCIPKGHRKFGERQDILNAGEFGRLIGLFAARGVGRVRLTGGEPLTRPDLLEIVQQVHSLPGIHDISLSTNATQLAAQADKLYSAGVRRLNVSLDSLNPARFARITGRDCLSDVLQGLDSAKAIGFSPIKINMVVQQGENDNEIDAMVEFCRARDFVLRFIERMPVGSSKKVACTHLQAIRQRLVDTHWLIDAVVPGGGPARYLKSPQGGMTVGFITPMSQHFCATCNRLRLGADGALYTCLDAAGSVPLGQHLREGASDVELQSLITEAIWSRPERHAFDLARDRSIRLMAVTGG